MIFHNLHLVNHDIFNTEQNLFFQLLSTDKQHHGVEKVNEKRLLEDASMAGSDDLCSDGAVSLDVNMAGSREGTLDQCALGAKKVGIVLVLTFLSSFF